MVTITYSLTPEDLADLEAKRRGGPLRRVIRVAAGVLAGFVGLYWVWQAIFFFPRNHWLANLLIASVGLVCLWGGLEMPGLAWLLSRFADPHAQQELCIHEGKIVSSQGGKTRQFRWQPKRGFQESGKFFFLRASASEAKWAIPKRAVNLDQEKSLRELVQQEPVRGDIIQCRFFLTEDELNDATRLIQPRINSTFYELASRVFFGVCALVIPWMLRMGKSWAEEFRTQPGIAVLLVAFALLCLWGATGFIGLKALNRLDLERRITISDCGVEVTRGAKTSTYKWRRLFSYHESGNLFVLRTQVTVEFWTIPKRALSPGEQERLRSLLDRKLPKQ